MSEGKKVVLKPSGSNSGKVALQARSQPVDIIGDERRCAIRKTATNESKEAASRKLSPPTDYVSAGESGGSSSSRAVVLQPGRPHGIQLRPNSGRVASNGSTPLVPRKVCLAPAKEPVAAKATVLAAAAAAASAAAAATPSASLRISGKVKPKELGRRVTLVKRATIVARTSEAEAPRKEIRLMKRRKGVAPPSGQAVTTAPAADIAKPKDERASAKRSGFQSRPPTSRRDDSLSVEAVEMVASPRALPQGTKRKVATTTSREEPERRHKRRSAGDATEATGASSSSRTRVQEAAKPLPAKTSEVESITTAADYQQLTERERAELRDSVHSHLRQMGSGNDDDAHVVADFVSALVEAQKTKEEMIDELTCFQEGAPEFVNWLHERIRRIVSKRKVKKSGMELRYKGPDQSKKVAKEPVKKVSSNDAIDLTNERPTLDVSQPTDKRKELLAQMTQQQKTILNRLSSPNLTDNEREQYRKMGATIQNKIKSLEIRKRP